MPEPGYIDLHHHVLPDFYRDELIAHQPAAGGGADLPGLKLPGWSPAEAIAVMDDAGIATGVTSVSFGVQFGDDAAAAVLARRCNEFTAGLIRDHPHRFGGFAVLPLPAVDAALTELAYALDVLGLDGVVLLSNHGGIYLGDARFDPIFEQLQDRRAVVFVHPNASPDAAARQLGLPDFLVDFAADTTRAVAKLHYSSTFARTPGVSYVFSHAGGTIPYLVSRFALLDRLAAMPGHGTRPTAAETFRRLYWDTALAFTKPVIQLVQQIAGTSQIVYGSDYPFTAGYPAESTRTLSTAGYLSAGDQQAIARSNALRFLPRLDATSRGPAVPPSRGRPRRQ